MKAALSLSTLLLIGVSSTATAQLISIRTVPVSQSHQFQIFPSRTMPMGGVSIAVTDSLLDPFSNPAMGMRLGATRFFGSPAAYSVSSDAGGGRTLPVGALAKRGAWFGGVWLALQEIDLNPGPDLSFVQPVCPVCGSAGIDLGPAELSKGNTYAFGMAGKDLGNGLSIGSSVMWSGLNAVDGVDLLYAGSARINQYGDALDLRLGLLKEWAGDRSLEAMVLHNRFGTTHDVFYLDRFWDPGTQQFSQRPRLEQNLDRTNTWGLHLAYEQPLSTQGWKAGAILTINRKDHPKIPNYEIMQIPRDPGYSSAFNVGFGLSRTLGASTFGVDLVYEPIWSHTWADAADPIETMAGKTIPKGGMTIENRFRFSNALARIGLDQGFTLGQAGPMGGLQLGLAMHSISYKLKQDDHVQISSRRHEERWVEWMPTWGMSLRFPELELRYTGSATHGTGRPGIAPNLGRGVVADAVSLASGGSNILAAPRGPLTLDEVRVMTHQISISLPIH
jgi:hypothetical protein